METLITFDTGKPGGVRAYPNTWRKVGKYSQIF